MLFRTITVTIILLVSIYPITELLWPIYGQSLQNCPNYLSTLLVLHYYIITLLYYYITLDIVTRTTPQCAVSTQQLN